MPRNSGPHEIKKKLDFNTYIIQVDGKETVVPVSRLKECRGNPPVETISLHKKDKVTKSASPASVEDMSSPKAQTAVTRSGRPIHIPGHFNYFILDQD